MKGVARTNNASTLAHTFTRERARACECMYSTHALPVSACVWRKATAGSGVGVVKHQRALKIKCWFQEPKPKPSAQNTVTRSKKSSLGDLAYMS